MLMDSYLVNQVSRKEKVSVIIVIIQIVIPLIIQIAVMAGTSSHMCWLCFVLLSPLTPLVGGHSLMQNTGTEKETETPGQRKGAERGDLGRRAKRRWPQCPPIS